MVQDVATNEFTVVWWRAGGGEDELRLRGVADPEAIFPAVRDDERYEARATGLAPGTSYRYEILRQDARPSPLCVGSASTAKQPGDPFSFLVFADSGGGRSPQYHLARVMGSYPSDFILHAGDLIYGKGPCGNYVRRFFQPYKHLLPSIPFYPVLGNHDLREDNGQTFLDKFSLPANGPPSVQPERCYWFDYGNARFVGIDSTLDQETLDRAVAPWLREILGTSSQQWKFVFLHHAPWEGGGRIGDGKIRATLVPAIEESGADIVFCGHNHLYERMHPMRAGQVVPSNGVLYVTSAAGGNNLHKEKHGDSPRLATYNNTQFSFTWVNVRGNQIELQQISEDDEILDQVVFRSDEWKLGT